MPGPRGAAAHNPGPEETAGVVGAGPLLGIRGSVDVRPSRR